MPQNLLALHIAVLLFGVSGLLGKLITVPVIQTVFFRTSVASVILALALFLRRDAIKLDRRTLLFMPLSGALLALHWGTFFYSIQVSTVAIGLLSYASFPIFVTILEPLVQRKSPKLSDVVLALVVAFGLILIVPEFDLSSGLTRGVLWGTVSGFSFALLTVANRLRASDVSADISALGQNAWAAIILLPFAINVWRAPTPQDLGLLLVLALACTALAHFLFIWALRAVTAHTASIAAALESVYGIAFSYLVLGEVPTLRMLIGGAVIIIASLVPMVWGRGT
jgi:drug/metabolite transporter (DMT)-like permease